MPAQEPTVIIAADKLSAGLVIPALCDRALFTEPLLLGLIRGGGVEVTDFTTRAVRDLLNDPPPEGRNTTLPIARAQPPVHGRDGSVQWFADEKHTETDAEHVQPDPDDAVSFYDRSAFVMVHAGDVVGKVHPAEPGQDGRDVTGANLPAKSGKDITLQLDETLIKRSDGSLTAQQDGVLYREPGKAQVRKRIEVKEYVDFSTGNLDFDGDITIGRGVRDRFTVKATGTVEVKGLIEAATIQTGMDLLAAGGFAGRERGNALIGRNLHGKYLDNVHGHVRQDLCIDREVINCELLIDGAIRSARGSIIGGKISPTGAVEISALGSASATVTELVIGSVPALQPYAQALTEIVNTLSADRDKLTNERDLTNKLSTKGRMTATDKERQTEIMFELSNIGASLDKAQRTLGNVNAEIDKRRCVDVTVHHAVYPAVTFILDGRRYKIYDDLHGPIRFYMDGRTFVCRQGDAPPLPVAKFSDVSAAIPGKNAA